VFDLFVKDGIENNQRSLYLCDLRRPATILAAVILQYSDNNRVSDLSLPPTFGPIRQKLCLSFIGQRVIE
jgi:hypothetical protein